MKRISRRSFMKATGISMLAAGVTACGAKDESSSAPAAASSSAAGAEAPEKMEFNFPLEESVTMTMFGQTPQSDVSLDEVLAFTQIEEATNVLWDVQSATKVDLNEKRGLLLNSGDYPDVFYKSGMQPAELVKYAEEGIIIDITDYIADYAPNLSKMMEEDPKVRYEVTQLDGRIYGLPTYNRDVIGVFAWKKYWLNQVWMDNLGLKTPNSMDDLYNVLKAFKEQDANGTGDASDQIPLLTTADELYNLSLYCGMLSDYFTRLIVDEKGVHTDKYMNTCDEYKEYLRFLKKLYDEKLMNQDVFTTSYAQIQAIATAGDVVGSFVHSGVYAFMNSNEHSDDYNLLLPFNNGKYPMHPPIVTSQAMVITDTCEHPELAVAWGDKHYSEEFSNWVQMGVEGISYEKNADGTFTTLVDTATWDTQKMASGAGLPYKLTDFAQQLDGDPLVAHTELQNRLVSQTDIGVTISNLKYSADDSAALARIKTDIDGYVAQYLAQVVTGEIDLDSTWDGYVGTINDMGLPEMLDIYRAAIAFYKESMGE